MLLERPRAKTNMVAATKTIHLLELLNLTIFLARCSTKNVVRLILESKS